MAIFGSRTQSVFSLVIINVLIISSILIFYSFENDVVLVVSEPSDDVSLDNSSAIPILKLYLDAKYAWDKLQLRKDIYDPNQTGFYYNTQVEANINYTSSNNLQFLPILYAMYKMTNDSAYLGFARELFLNILKYTTSQINVSGVNYDILSPYDSKNDILLDSSFTPIGLFVPIALEDPFYIPYFEKLLSNSHEVFWSPLNLIYRSRAKDGTITGKICHLTWGTSVSKKINQLLWMAAITGNSTYKNWADDTIDAIWSHSSSSGLLPRSVNPSNGQIIDSTVSHYDMAGWLCMLELAFFLNNRSMSAGTSTHTYFDLISAAAQGIANYMWTSSQRWGYKTSFDAGTTSNGIPEMNAIYVDYAMILAYEITQTQDFLTKAIIDFENEFMGNDPVIPNGVLMSNSLVIHSPNTLATQCQFSGSSNIMVARTASLIYKYTQDDTFLQKARLHYQHLMSTHRFSKGYTNKLNSLTLKPYPIYNGYPSRILDSAPFQAILALPNAFISTENVTIDWGYGLTTTMPAGYGKPGVFTGVTIDLEHRRVHLKSVSSDSNGYLLAHFANGSIIQSVVLDNDIPYYSFTNNTLSCEEGTHAYTITFTEPNDWNYSTLITNLPPIITTTATTSIPTSYSSSTSIETTSSNSTSSTTITTSTEQTTGFFTSIFPIFVASLAIIVIKRRKRHK